MPKDWATAKEIIHTLYIEENRTLQDVRQVMIEIYGFRAW
jgi:hypothetical protein